MLDHKASRGKFKKIEIVSVHFSNHNARRLEINYKKKILQKKTTHTHTHTNVKPNMLLNNQWVTEEVKEEIK